MFDIHCAGCGKRQLLAPGQVRTLINDDEGIAVIYACYCGELGALRTGAAHEARHEAGAAA